jgi:predicted DsbA family dithiol-disulfide isomerase
MMDEAPKMTRHAGLITVISDTICPWCYVGKRRLEAALKILAEEGLSFDVEWRPFQLNPDMPDDGMNRRDYRTAKFGSPESDALDGHVQKVGLQSDIDFRFDLIERTPNTLASHVMIADARHAGGLVMQNNAIETLFAAYFTKGRDVGKAEVLREIAFEAGFDHGPDVTAELWEFVQEEEKALRQSGLNSVPTFLFNGRYLMNGAQPTTAHVEALRRAAAEVARASKAAISGANT